MGELHLEVIRHRMERDFKLKVRVHKPRVSYREAIRKSAEGVGEFHRPSGDESQSCRVTLRAEPADAADAPVAIQNKLRHDALPPELVILLEDAVVTEARTGALYGYPLMGAKFTIVSVELSAEDAAETALQAAASMAVREVLENAGGMLLEPIMRVEVTTPDEFLGNIQSDLNARRAVIVNSEIRGDLSVLEAYAPAPESALDA